MKCVKLINNEIYRVDDLIATNAVRLKLAVYCNKAIWKKTGRKYYKGNINGKLTSNQRSEKS